MAAPKKVPAKKAAPSQAKAPKKPAPKVAPKTRAPKPAPQEDAPVVEPKKKAPSPKRDPSLGPVVKTRVATAGAAAPRTKTRVEKTRVAIPMAYYDAHKDEVKAPIKALGLKWNFLGEGKGLYKRDRDVHCFTQFLDDGVHYSVWGDDKKAVDELLDAWRKLAGDAAFAQWLAAGEGASVKEAAVQESEAVKLWKLQEPQRRPGEPDLFYDKRRAEWMAKKPA